MPAINPADAVRKAIAESEIVAALKAARVPAEARALTGEEIQKLEANGNGAADWSQVMVRDGFDPSRVRGSHFAGPVVIGRLEGEIAMAGGVKLGAGIYNADLSNVVVGDGALISGVSLLANYVIGEGAAVVGCGEVVTGPGATFGNGEELAIAIETGGREVRTYAEITVDAAATVASRRADKDLIAAYGAAVDAYVRAVTSDVGVIGPGAMVKSTPKVIDTFVGEGAVIDGATLVQNTTILSLADEQTEILSGAFVRDSIIQWGSEVASMAIVDKSVLTEHSHVERHGKVTESLLGPNTGVAEGEVTASLCGPFVGFHHQSLLIAAFWPEGKGNVGYGANVGSNHTAKAPDQEIWCGEGTFFGMGVNIKFPSDFTQAPYCIIASGVSALPQRVEMPFSLINTPAAVLEGVSPAYNEITPGWVLSDNIFTLRRNEGKYRKRNKARRSTFDFEVFRPETVDMMLEARERLQAAGGKQIYTARDVKGLGKNYMSEAARTNGIDAYTFYIRSYALSGFEREMAAGGDPGKLLAESSEHTPRWEHERRILASEMPDAAPADLLRALNDMAQTIAEATQSSKEKDDTRGARVIADYSEAHPPAAEDGFVRETWESTRALQAEIKELLGKL